jgi:hypothetical protein
MGTRQSAESTTLVEARTRIKKLREKIHGDILANVTAFVLAVEDNDLSLMLQSTRGRPFNLDPLTKHVDCLSVLQHINLESVANSFGCTALMVAVGAGYPRATTILIEANADLQASCDHGGVLGHVGYWPDIARFLFQSGARFGNSRVAGYEATRKLMCRKEEEHGRPVPSDNNNSFLMACGHDNQLKEVQRMLTEVPGLSLEHGLTTAAEYGHAHIVQWLIRQKADINRYTPFHDTPLHRAVVTDNASMVRLLLRLGANPRAGHRKNTSRRCILLPSDRERFA